MLQRNHLADMGVAAERLLAADNEIEVMNRFPVLNQVIALFSALFYTIGLWNSIVLIFVFGYCFVYAISLYSLISKMKDIRTLGYPQEKNRLYSLLRSRLSRREPFTLIYIVFIPLFYILFLTIAFLTFGR